MKTIDSFDCFNKNYRPSEDRTPRRRARTLARYLVFFPCTRRFYRKLSAADGRTVGTDRHRLFTSDVHANSVVTRADTVRRSASLADRDNASPPRCYHKRCRSTADGSRPVVSSSCCARSLVVVPVVITDVPFSVPSGLPHVAAGDPLPPPPGMTRRLRSAIYGCSVVRGPFVHNRRGT